MKHLKSSNPVEFRPGPNPFVIRELGNLEKFQSQDPEKFVSSMRRFLDEAGWFDPMKEHVIVCTLSARLDITGFSLVHIGSEDESLCVPSDIFRAVICTGNNRFILCHNHPGGNPSPSLPDQNSTIRVREGADLLGLKFIDHIIIGDPESHKYNAYFSFREAGIL